MLTKSVGPKTKAELIRALQSASFTSVDVFEGDRLGSVTSAADLRRKRASVIVTW